MHICASCLQISDLVQKAVLDGNEKTQKLAQTFLLPAYAFWAVSIAQMHVVAAMYMDKLVHLVKVRVD